MNTAFLNKFKHVPHIGEVFFHNLYTPGSVQSTSGVFINGYYLQIPVHSGDILEFHEETETFNSYGNMPANYKWEGGIGYNNKLYAVPLSRGTILKFDTVTKAISEFGSGLPTYSGAHVVQNYLLGVPHHGNGGQFLKIDLDTDTISHFGTVTSSLAWGHTDGNDVYMTSFQSGGNIYKVNPITESITIIKSSVPYQLLDCVKVGNYLYCSEFNAQKIHKLNLTTGNWEGEFNSAYGISQGILHEHEIIFNPAGVNFYSIFDTITEKFYYVPSNTHTSLAGKPSINLDTKRIYFNNVGNAASVSTLKLR